MDSRTSAVTTTCTVLTTLPDVAVIIAVPADTAVTMPVLLTTATAVLLELNTTPDVNVDTVPLLKDPTTVNCEVRPAAIELAAEVTEMDSRTAALTAT